MADNTPDDLKLLLEAERRGVPIPKEDQDFLQAARARGLAPSLEGSDKQSAPAAPAPKQSPSDNIPVADTMPLIPYTGDQWRRMASDARGVAAGITAPFEGAVQLMPHVASYLARQLGGGDTTLSGVLDAAKKREDALMASRGAERAQDRASAGYDPDSPDVAKFAGSLLSPMPYKIGGAVKAGSNALGNAFRTAANLGPAPAETALLPRIAQAAGTGAAIGASEPVTSGDYGAEKTGQIESGALLGGGLEGLATGVGPWAGQRAMNLLNRGIPLTIGQILGRFLNRAEQISMSTPLSGMQVRSAREAAEEGLNRATANEALAPTNQSVDQNTAAGRDMMKEVNKKVSDFYDATIPRLKGQLDYPFAQDIRTIYNNLPRSMRDTFEESMERDLLKNIRDADPVYGRFSGRDVKDVDRKFRDEGIRNIQSGDPDQYKLGEALLQVREKMRDMWTRHNTPELIADLNNADKAFSMARIMERASSYVGARDGVFGGNQLFSAVRAEDPTVGKRALTEGRARLQGLAEDAKDVMGQSIGDSFTPERSSTLGLLGLGAAGTAFPWKVIPAIGGHMAAYSAPAQAMFRLAASKSPQTRNMLASGIRQAAPGIIAAENDRDRDLAAQAKSYVNP